MIEFIIMIFVAGWFAKTANKNGEPGGLWGLIGAISYYVPTLIFGFYIYPAMIRGTYYSISSQSAIVMQGVLLSVLTGVCCCIIARVILLNKINKSKSNDKEIFSDSTILNTENKGPTCPDCNANNTYFDYKNNVFCRNCMKITVVKNI